MSVVLSGMNTMRQVEKNLKSADKAKVHSLSQSDYKLIETLQQQYRSKIPIPCTKCGYCLPCPNGVNIPHNFELYNNGFIHDDYRGSQFTYARFMAEQDRAGSCVGCRICEEKCPQKIPIGEWMPKIHVALGAK